METLGTYVRIQAGSEKGLGGEWHVYFSERNKVTEVGAVISWRNQKSKTNWKAKASLQPQFHRHGGPPLCVMLCLSLGLPKWMWCLWLLGLVGRGMKTNMHCKPQQRFKRCSADSVLTTHFFHYKLSHPNLFLDFIARSFLWDWIWDDQALTSI